MDQQVTVDAGDLSEAQQAATAWAGYLRDRADLRARAQREGLNPDGLVLSASDSEAADRIDRAVAALNFQAHESLV